MKFSTSILILLCLSSNLKAQEESYNTEGKWVYVPEEKEIIVNKKHNANLEPLEINEVVEIDIHCAECSDFFQEEMRGSASKLSAYVIRGEDETRIVVEGRISHLVIPRKIERDPKDIQCQQDQRGGRTTCDSKSYIDFKSYTQNQPTTGPRMFQTTFVAAKSMRNLKEVSEGLSHFLKIKTSVLTLPLIHERSLSNIDILTFRYQNTGLSGQNFHDFVLSLFDIDFRFKKDITKTSQMVLGLQSSASLGRRVQGESKTFMAGYNVTPYVGLNIKRVKIKGQYNHEEIFTDQEVYNLKVFSLRNELCLTDDIQAFLILSRARELETQQGSRERLFNNFQEIPEGNSIGAGLEYHF